MTTCQQKLPDYEIYNRLYRRGYPHGGLGFPITWSKIKCEELKCLDIGCGHGILCKRFKKYVGIDISDYVIDRNKENFHEIEFYALDILALHQQAFSGFDLVLAIDVLEHLPAEEIFLYLSTISDLNAKMYLFSICCRKSGYRGPNGEELHKCILTPDEWMELLEINFKIVDSSEMNRQSTFCVKAENL